ncbi:hypothetical protein [Gimesia aquarii]|uniref:Uncharacterized protein n=1 Tax=Gimesia aquarii TaxID=2527964 RepID=A0A517VYZ9_9PLAN|nr:hypothetical protein [Gimesia aquarii]QDT98226.1 hypothetical protein V144x_37120 [Gimesia aquarii]
MSSKNRIFLILFTLSAMSFLPLAEWMTTAPFATVVFLPNT